MQITWISMVLTAIIMCTYVQETIRVVAYPATSLHPSEYGVWKARSQTRGKTDGDLCHMCNSLSYVEPLRRFEERLKTGLLQRLITRVYTTNGHRYSADVHQSRMAPTCFAETDRFFTGRQGNWRAVGRRSRPTAHREAWGTKRGLFVLAIALHVEQTAGCDVQEVCRGRVQYTRSWSRDARRPAWNHPRFEPLRPLACSVSVLVNGGHSQRGVSKLWTSYLEADWIQCGTATGLGVPASCWDGILCTVFAC
ncbi:hypothetical protein PYCCODRAFT_346217 [Trametes coccinea BRFM310]|uniref:Secreted protein n=1 Tax=Trametes coccinea (strain BRFM310) TaxID=1353009 RepID=A0A1Y2J4L0_TRAC3|nr:hypothetical protein PYCCODRAFT_346217 [Trametes coccinea BRFM310]